MAEQWRELDTETREAWVGRVYDLLAGRFGPDSVGRKQYGDTFQGDPLDQLVEEMADGLFYALVAKARQAEIVNAHDKVLALVEAADDARHYLTWLQADQYNYARGDARRRSVKLNAAIHDLRTAYGMEGHDG